MSAFLQLEELAPRQIWDGVLARVVGGERQTLAVIELEPDSVVPEHRHDNEQVGLIVSGALTFRIGDETREVRAGGAWSIPPNVPHEVRTGPDGAVLIEAFAPARTDWDGLERLDAHPPRWPVARDPRAAVD